MRLKPKKAFTLVELIIVVSIIAILASLAFMSLSAETAEARDSKRFSDLKTFENAISVSNGKNKPINYLQDLVGLDNNGNHRSNPNIDNLETNNGYLKSIRGAYLIPISSTLFESDILATVPTDPKGSYYLGAFLSSTDYSFYATLENPKAKTPTAIIQGTFKNGMILDILMNDSDDTNILKVANPSRFIRGDIIQIDHEYMVVREYNNINKTIAVDRGYNPTATIGEPFDNTTIKVHNKGTSIKLFKPVKDGENLVCLGAFTNAESGNITITSSPQAHNYAGDDYTNLLADTSTNSIGETCQNGKNLINESIVLLPYKIN